MKSSWILFGLLLAMWLVLGATLFIPESNHARGVQHQQHPAMNQAGFDLGQAHLIANSLAGQLYAPISGPMGPAIQFPIAAKVAEADSFAVGQIRHERLISFGWMFASLQVLFFACVLCFAVRRSDRFGKVSIFMLFGAIIELLVFAAIFLSYGRFLTQTKVPFLGFLTETNVSFLGPFPTPTAVMIFGIWAAPFLYVVLYIVAFPRLIWTRESEEKFQGLLQARQQP